MQTPSMNILYVEDDPGLGSLLKKCLLAQDHTVNVVGGVIAASHFLADTTPDLILCDHNLPDGSGLELMKTVLSKHADLPCIMLTGVGSEALAVSAMKAGARDYVVKDIENNFLSLVPVVIARIGKEQRLEHELFIAEQEKNRLKAQNHYLSTSLKRSKACHKPIGQHPSFKRLLSVVEQVAPTDASVLISGETGTGKEMAARLIHDMSCRADSPFITVNCAALPAQLFESELFGHEKGAFTGAIKSRAGRFEAADGGTLFLDEVGELPIELQPKLLRVLQDSKFERIGSTLSRTTNIRILAATNQNLPSKVADKSFRSDLYYRLNVIPIQIPPLRMRATDIELLFMHFLRNVSQQYNLTPPETNSTIMQSIKDYAWPGNVRELNNYVERGVITQRWEPLPTIDIQHSGLSAGSEVSDSPLTLSELERTHIIKVLQQTRGMIAGKLGAAEILGINANTLRSRMKKLGIERPNFTL